MRARAPFTALALLATLAAGSLADDPEAAAADTAQITSGVELRASFGIDASDLSYTPSVVFSPDGERLLVGTAQGEFLEFEADTRRVLRREQLFKGQLTGLDVHFASDLLVVIGYGGSTVETRRLSDVNELLATWEEDSYDEDLGPIRAVAISPDGTQLAAATDFGFELCALPSLKRTAVMFANADEFTSVDWTPDGKHVVAVSASGVLRVIEPSGPSVTFSLECEDPLYAVSCSPLGNEVAFGGEAFGHNVMALDLTTHATRVLATDQPYWITVLDYSRSGELLAIGDESCDVWIQDPVTAERLFHGKHHEECWLDSVAWAPDNATFLFGCRPNDHAGEPETWRNNTHVEAFNDGQHQRLLAEERAAAERLAARLEAGELGQVGNQLAALLAKRDELLVDEFGGVAGGSFSFDEEEEPSQSAAEAGAMFAFEDLDALDTPDWGGGGGAGGVLSFDDYDSEEDGGGEPSPIELGLGLDAVQPAPLPGALQVVLELDGEARARAAEAEASGNEEQEGAALEPETGAALAEIERELARLRAQLAEDPDVAALLELEARRREVFDDKVADLEEGFQLNVWRVRR